MAHGDAREGKCRGNWRMEWVASRLTPPPNVVYPALLKLMCTPRLPAVDWTDAPTDLNGLVRFGERRNLVSARVPSHSARVIQHKMMDIRIKRSSFGSLKIRPVVKFRCVWCGIFFVLLKIKNWPRKQHEYQSACSLAVTHEQNEYYCAIVLSRQGETC